jgi:3-hydroxy-3-methylglutaryl CoA synthase
VKQQEEGTMIGVTSFGAYVPRYRLNRFMIFTTMGWYNPVTMAVAGTGEKAVANYDEDSVTMAVAAAQHALGGTTIGAPGAVFLGSTTLPYRERLNAAIVAGALDLPEATRSADVTGSLRAGTGALLVALDAVAVGSVPSAVACAADVRLGKMGSLQEHFFGDGAAALAVGSENVIAKFLGSHTVTADFVDHFRDAGERFDHTWEERWIRDLGYSKIIPDAVAGLLAKLSLKASDFAKIVFPCYFDREHRAVAKGLGIKAQDNLGATVGDTGAAHPLLMFAAALEDAKPGDKLLLVGFGSGADALAFEVTEAITKLPARQAVKAHLARKEDLNFYAKYAVFRRIVPVEMGIRGESQAPTAFSALWRDRRAVLGLVGSKCTACGLPQFPPQRICANPDCRTLDKMEPYRLAGRTGKVFTFTGDMLAFSYDPPQVYGMVDIDGGGRLYLDFTDCDLQKLAVGQPVALSFRRKYFDEQRGIHGYFWKAVPLSGAQA